MVHLDSSSLFMVSICPLVIYLILNTSFSYFGSYSSFSFSKFFVLVISIVCLCFLVSYMFHFLILLELTVIPMCLLLLSFSKDKDKVSSTSFMLLINIFGSIPFMINSSIFIDDTITTSNFIFSSTNSFYLIICFLLILCCKLPVFLSHFWLTKAHVAGSGACSMLLASLMLKMGSYGLMKFVPFFLSVSNRMVSSLLSFSLMGLLVFCMFMIRFLDVKVLIASSSIVHMGLILPLILHYSYDGILGSMFMMTSHGLCSYILFYILSVVYEVSHSRSMDFNKCLESNFKYMSMVMFVFIFINLGVPPLISFLSELYFCMFFYKVNLTSIFFFFIFMLAGVLFTMFVLTKVLFGKKNFSGSNNVCASSLNNSMQYLLFMGLLPFIY